MRRYLWQQKPWQAFKIFAILFSFVVNLVLLVLLFLVAPLIIPVVDIIVDPLVGGLATSFVEMKEANIQQTIVVDDELPVVFDLPVSETTTVVLTEEVPLTVPATFDFPDGGGSINGTVTIRLPQGLNLPIQLEMVVPVDQRVPVNLDVAVDIPLDETELGPPFRTLEGLFTPLEELLKGLPNSNEDLLRRVNGAGEAPLGAAAIPR